jgi:hypothetical protein
MSAPPYMKFYTGDYDRDTGTCADQPNTAPILCF